MNVHDEFTRRVAADRLCAAVMKAMRENDTAALGRLGMRGFAQYAGRLSELMTECARRRLLGADDFGAMMDEDDFGAIMGEVAKPAHYAHHLVNEGGTAIQQALDRRNGVRLRVIEPEFNDGRLKGIVGEASESDSENAADNLATQLGTFVKDMGNEFMRQNAEQRDRAGFKVTITRTGGAKCCPWCADRTGKWELANAPDGVFGCHDNCKCVVDYTNSKGTVRGKAVGKKWNFAEIPYEPPRRMSAREAAEKGAFSSPKRLTKEHESDKIIGGELKPMSYSSAFQVSESMLNSNEFRNKFSNISDDPAIAQKYYEECCKILRHRSGNNGEDLYYHDPVNDIWYKSTSSKYAGRAVKNNEIKAALEKTPRGILISFHNHAKSKTPSVEDFNAALEYGYAKGYVICHNGRIFEYTPPAVEVDKQVIEDSAFYYYTLGADEQTSYLMAYIDNQQKYGYTIKEVL